MKSLFTLALLAFVPLLQADVFSDKFAVIMIDDQTEARLGPFPYDRSVLGKAVEACARNRAKAVVLKFFFDRPRSAAGDAALGDAMRKIPVVLQARIEATEGTTKPIPDRFAWPRPQATAPLASAVRGPRAWVPLPELMDAAAALGFVDFDTPAIPLVEEYKGVAYKSLVICCLELALDAPARAGSGKIYFGTHFLPVNAANVFHAELDGREAAPMLSFGELLSDEARHASELEGRVVIIGYDAASMPTISTPHGPVRLHRYFVQCLAAAYRAAEANKEP